MQTEIRTYRHTDTHTYRIQIYRQTYRQSDKHLMDRLREIHTDRQTHIQIYRKTYIQTDRQTHI